jgi:hypothetical protein
LGHADLHVAAGVLLHDRLRVVLVEVDLLRDDEVAAAGPWRRKPHIEVDPALLSLVERPQARAVIAGELGAIA